MDTAKEITLQFYVEFNNEKMEYNMVCSSDEGEYDESEIMEIEEAETAISYDIFTSEEREEDLTEGINFGETMETEAVKKYYNEEENETSKSENVLGHKNNAIHDNENIEVDISDDKDLDDCKLSSSFHSVDR